MNSDEMRYTSQPEKEFVDMLIQMTNPKKEERPTARALLSRLP